MDILINSQTNDIDLTNSTMRLTPTIQDLTRQRLAITLKTFRGEWFANTNYGVPYLERDSVQRPLLSKTSQNVLNFEIQRAILSTEGIVEITAYSSTYDPVTRSVNIRFSAITENGEIISDVLEV